MDNNNIMNTADFDGLHEECGVFGAYDFDGETLHLQYTMVFLHYSTEDRKAAVLP